MSMLTMLLAFTVVLADPMEWLYPDSKVEETVSFEEIAVPKDGRVGVNILFNGLKAGERVGFSASAQGEWYELISVPVEENASPIFISVSLVERPPSRTGFSTTMLSAGEVPAV